MESRDFVLLLFDLLYEILAYLRGASFCSLLELKVKPDHLMLLVFNGIQQFFGWFRIFELGIEFCDLFNLMGAFLFKLIDFAVKLLVFLSESRYFCLQCVCIHFQLN